MVQRGLHCPRDMSGEIDFTGAQSSTFYPQAKTP